MQRLIAFLSMAAIAATAVAPSFADDTAKQQGDQVAALAKKLIASPDDTDAFNKYMIAALNEIRGEVSSNPKAAMEKLEAMNETLAAVKPTAQQTKRLLQQAKRVADSYKNQIAAAQATVKELVAKLEKNPNDASALSVLQTKLVQEIGSNARSNPDVAEKTLRQAKEIFGKLEKNTTDPAIKNRIASIVKSLDRYSASIEAGRKLKELIGKPMAPLGDVVAWINSDGITPEDLKGKVVLLDFWAVWCGPCIATFPHLREWHEKYADKGLVIIGVTRYYNYKWDDDAKRATRSQAKVSPAEENAMLEKFLAHHKLKHAVAVTSDRSASQAYGVTGIPHVVVIDRDGKIRLIRVGSGEKNAHDIEEMIKKLIGDKA